MRILLILFFSFQAYAQSFDVVFDLDRTLIFEESSNIPYEEIIEVEGLKYKVAKGAKETVSAILQMGGRVSFFSGGGVSRNEGVLKSIKLSDGRSFFDIKHDLKSRPDLLKASEQANQVSELEIFKGELLKDLTKITGIDLARTFFVDDVTHFSARAQEFNLVWIGHFSDKSLDKILAKFDRITKTGTQEDLSNKFIKELFSRNHLLYVLGLIEFTLEESARTGKTIPETLRQIQYIGEGNQIKFSRNTLIDFMTVLRRGVRLIKKINPKYQIEKIPLVCY